MADIFISYARPDREIAKGLAEALTSRGYQVWWDYELLGGDEFRDVILDELRAAKAVIVIWTGNSAKSPFVRDEASRAQSQNKLVATSVDGFDTKMLPLGFGGLHCHPIGAIDKTIKAISRLRAIPAASKTTLEQAHLLAEEAFWSAIENSTDPNDFEIYLEEYKTGVHRALARLKLSRLKPSSKPPEKSWSFGKSRPSGAALFLIWALVTLGAMLTFGKWVVGAWVDVVNGYNHLELWAAVLLSLIYTIFSVLFIDYALRGEGWSLGKSRPSGAVLFLIWALVTLGAMLTFGKRVVGAWVDVVNGYNHLELWAAVLLSLIYTIFSVLFIDYALRKRKA